MSQMVGGGLVPRNSLEGCEGTQMENLRLLVSWLTFKQANTSTRRNDPILCTFKNLSSHSIILI